jgi:hypothetical protein
MNEEIISNEYELVDELYTKQSVRLGTNLKAYTKEKDFHLRFKIQKLLSSYDLENYEATVLYHLGSHHFIKRFSLLDKIYIILFHLSRTQSELCFHSSLIKIFKDKRSFLLKATMNEFKYNHMDKECLNNIFMSAFLIFQSKNFKFDYSSSLASFHENVEKHKNIDVKNLAFASILSLDNFKLAHHKCKLWNFITCDELKQMIERINENRICSRRKPKVIRKKLMRTFKYIKEINEIKK